MANPFADSKILVALPWNSDVVFDVAFIGNDKVSAANRRGDILIWNLPATGGESPKPVRHLVGHTRAINCLLLSLDGKTLISAGNDRTVKFWDALLTTGELAEVVLNDGVVRKDQGGTMGLNKIAEPPPPVTANVVVQKPLRN